MSFLPELLAERGMAFHQPQQVRITGHKIIRHRGPSQIEIGGIISRSISSRMYSGGVTPSLRAFFLMARTCAGLSLMSCIAIVVMTLL
jgi:hypothetical protein